MDRTERIGPKSVQEMQEQDAHNPISNARIQEVFGAKNCPEGNAHNASRCTRGTAEEAYASRIFALWRERRNDQEGLRLEQEK
jgi:hypothetical protein